MSDDMVKIIQVILVMEPSLTIPEILDLMSREDNLND